MSIANTSYPLTQSLRERLFTSIDNSDRGSSGIQRLFNLLYSFYLFMIHRSDPDLTSRRPGIQLPTFSSLGTFDVTSHDLPILTTHHGTVVSPQFTLRLLNRCLKKHLEPTTKRQFTYRNYPDLSYFFNEFPFFFFDTHTIVTYEFPDL